MLKLFTKLWRWLKSLFVRPSPPKPATPPPELSDLEWENILGKLLEEVVQGKSWGQLQGFLVGKKVDKERLASWLQRFGERWLDQPELHQELAQRLVRLGAVATGELGVVARRLGGDLLVSLQLESSVTAGSSNGEQESEPVVSSASGGLESSGVQALIDQYIQQYQAGDYQGAWDAINRATQMYPNEPIGWQARGELMKIFQQYGEALASFDQVIKLQPDFYPAWYSRGDVLNTLGQINEVLASFDQVIKLQPDYYQAWYNRGNVLRELGQYQEALASYDQAIKLQPDYYQAWYNRGNVLRELGQYQEALASFDQVIKLRPDEHLAWGNRGFVLEDLGQYQEALASYDQAIKLRPDEHLAWGNRGNVLRELGQYQEALASYDQTLKLQPDFYQAWANRGIAAGKIFNYAPFEQHLFIPQFRLEVTNAPQQLIPSIEATDWEQHLTQFQASLRTSTELLLNTFSHSDAPELIAKIQQSPSVELSQLIRKHPPAELIEFIQQPLSEVVIAKLEQDFLFHPPQFNSQLNQRGYEGKLASFQAELDKAICRDTHPEGWGILHHEIGKAHYFRGQEDVNASSFWRKAKDSYKEALKTLKPPEFEELHLEVLQDLIRVLRELHDIELNSRDIEEARELNRQGADLLRKMLAAPQRTEYQKQKLALKSAVFDQLTVDFALQSGDILGAFTLAERGKNTCLRWLLERKQDLGDLGNGERDGCATGDLRQLDIVADSNTAAIYWHLSPSTLTTFVILPGVAVPIVVERQIVPNQNEQRSPSLLQFLAWEKWLSNWNEQYQAYGNPKADVGKGNVGAKHLGDSSSVTPKISNPNASPSESFNHSWRTQMEGNLEELKTILNIDAIAQYLENHQIEHLILIPHRDLHRLPLHYFFDNFTCTYLPSIQYHVSQSQQQTTEEGKSQLLLVENPDSTPEINSKAKQLVGLPFAEVEAAIIRNVWIDWKTREIEVLDDKPTQKLLLPPASCLLPSINTIENQAATKEQVQQSLSQPHQVFHFTGHGAYNSTNPAKSCLFLSGKDRLTLLDIINLDLSSYQLICLAACETAVTGNQTITDEYVGLVSAFLRAGATHVISTLWTVESAASALLMVEFYQQLETGQPPAAALKAAQSWLKTATRDQLIAWLDLAIAKLYDEPAPRLVLEDRREVISRMDKNHIPFSHPYYWAAFSISGVT
ncbi:MAG: CHAT domain-containing protein [Symploca sp. SIO2D2]|nr:CHAT domain-containing protein [Symploca sp. SIO2D2]